MAAHVKVVDDEGKQADQDVEAQGHIQAMKVRDDVDALAPHTSAAVSMGPAC